MKQSITFAKMHGLGNDFMVIDAINQTIKISSLLITTLADRHTGVGFDQLLLIKSAKKADFYCQIFNADGSEAEQCGNGLRCIARFVSEKALTKKSSFTIETVSGVYPVAMNGYDNITVAMGVPDIVHQETELTLPDGNILSSLSVLSVGNPHAILQVERLEAFDIENNGRNISTHSFFPAGTNVGFMEIVNPHHIRLRTYERGSGETLACGSNACAAAVTGISRKLLKNPVTIEYQLGKLIIQWEGGDTPIQMTGSASLVYMGEIKSYLTHL